MSKPVAIVDGKKVFSDKTLESVVGTRLFFTDGSWCDVSTGEVSNRGPGFIDIGTPGEEPQTETKKETFFKARALEASDLFADLGVQVHDKETIEVVMTGPADVLKDVDIHQRGDTVVIEGRGDGGVSGITVVIGGGRGVSITGSSIVVGGVEGESAAKITVTVPKGTAVGVANINGHTTIGDTEGPLRVNARGGSNVDVGRVGGAMISVQGSSDVTVEEVTGNLTMSVQGSGDIRVLGGRVSTLTASVQGSGDISFGGEAEDAALRVMGSGDIRVNHVTNRPVTSVMGSGDIKVGR